MGDLAVQGDQSITRDVVTIMRRFRLLGFNAVRVPFSMVNLFQTAPRNFNGTCTSTPDATLLADTTEPGIKTPGKRLAAFHVMSHSEDLWCCTYACTLECLCLQACAEIVSSAYV